MAEMYLASFGWKIRLPPSGCRLFDARVIRNPMHRFGKRKTGLSPEVIEYVLGTSAAAQALVRQVVHAALSGEQYIAVGCDWGHHRSVSVVEQAAQEIERRTGQRPIIDHLELDEIGL